MCVYVRVYVSMQVKELYIDRREASGYVRNKVEMEWTDVVS